MIEAPDSPHRVPFDGTFRVADAATTPPSGHADAKKQLKQNRKVIADLQRVLYAQDQISLLLVFQAMDAAGKDSTIRAVTSGVNPAGCQVFSFKKPSSRELDHDFLWRTASRLPERGRIGIFNRSYYEEVLVVRVHPEFLKYQRLPEQVVTDNIWQERFESIAEHEKHLARNGTVVLKFWLNVSQREQHARFAARLDTPSKHWKFSKNDVKESRRWPDYMAAYEDAINATSTPWAPWYAIPADDKPYMRAAVSQIIRDTLESLDLKYPHGADATDEEIAAARQFFADSAAGKAH
ncbi:MAG: PPK2 family polyphosphate kinase [Pseudomonadota bacterium]